MDRILLSKLKGINIYIENDFYEMALLMLKLTDAKAKYDESKIISSPTVNGLGKKFAQFIDSIHPDYDKVFSEIKKHKVPLGIAIEFDDNCNNFIEKGNK